MLATKTLILGGVRSGKSRLAERLARDTSLPVIYVATATADDDEMRQRIEQHRQHRPAQWLIVEEPIQLANAIKTHAAPNHCILVDCLTLWLTNLLVTDDLALLEKELAALLHALPNVPGQLILVSNETNMGITPLGELSRRYCDEAGRLHQQLAQLCDRVVLTIAGLPHVLKGESV